MDELVDELDIMSEEQDATDPILKSLRGATPRDFFAETTAPTTVISVPLTQWAQLGNGFIPSGPTSSKLIAGSYAFSYYKDTLITIKQDINTDNLIRFPDSQSDEVIKDIEAFWNLGENYKKFGLSHKRGYLLHGPQGSGKTSTISFISAEHTKNDGICFIVDNGVHPLNLAAFLRQAREVEPDRFFLIILEDLDAIIKQYGERDILSLLDGQLSINKAVFIATTNYINSIEPRIRNRPSRFDRVLEISTPNLEFRKLYLQSRKLELNEDQYSQWAKDTEGFSVAHLKELIISVFCYGQEYKTVLQRLKDMFKSKSEKQLESGTSGFLRK